MIGPVLEFPQQHSQDDARQRKLSPRSRDRKAQSCRGGHLHVAIAMERVVQHERLADGR